MNKKRIIAGVDIGGTNTVIGFIGEDGDYLFGSSILTSPDEEANKFIVRLTNEINLVFKEYGENYHLGGIGIAAPSANQFQGTIESPSNLKWGNVNFINMMKEYFDVPISIVNDANAAAIGEYEYGLAKGMKNFIVITLGTGLGSGIVVDGNLLYGENGLAGELGHTIIEQDGRMCNCGRTGCLETYVSVTGIRRTIFDLLTRYNYPSELRDISFNQLTGEMVTEHAKKGDPIALKAFDFTGEVLGKAIANLVACFTSEAIILFGGLVESGDLLIEPTKFYFEKNLLGIHKGKVKILKSKFENGMAAILGASSLITKEIDKKVSFKLNHLSAVEKQ